MPFHQLLAKAASGEEFARNFFSIFIPHASHQAAREVVPGLVERTLTAARKEPAFQSEEDVVFYHCRFIGEDNKCQIWEDRPQLCRDYPNSPLMVFAPGCAFEPWAKMARQRFVEMKAELAQLKTLQDELAQTQMGTPYTKIDSESCANDNLDILSLVLLPTTLYLASPVGSYLSAVEQVPDKMGT